MFCLHCELSFSIITKPMVLATNTQKSVSKYLLTPTCLPIYMRDEIVYQKPFITPSECFAINKGAGNLEGRTVIISKFYHMTLKEASQLPLSTQSTS